MIGHSPEAKPTPTDPLAIELSSIGGTPINIALAARRGDMDFSTFGTRHRHIILTSHSDNRTAAILSFISLQDGGSLPTTRIQDEHGLCENVATRLFVSNVDSVTILYRDENAEGMGQLVERDNTIFFADPVHGPQQGAVDTSGLPLTPYCTIEIQPKRVIESRAVDPIVIEVFDWMAVRTK